MGRVHTAEPVAVEFVDELGKRPEPRIGTQAQRGLPIATVLHIFIEIGADQTPQWIAEHEQALPAHAPGAAPLHLPGEIGDAAAGGLGGRADHEVVDSADQSPRCDSLSPGCDREPGDMTCGFPETPG